VTAPNEDRWVVEEVPSHLDRLCHDCLVELWAFFIPPLQRKVLPNQHASAVRFPVKALGTDVSVNSNSVDMGSAHQLEVMAIAVPVHLAEPLGCDVVGSP